MEGKKVEEIAKELKLSKSTVYYRIKKLKDKGIIRERIEINWTRLGYNIQAYVLIKTENLTIFDQKKLLDKIRSVKNIVSGAVISGNYDIIVEVVAKDINELGEILNKIKSIEGVKRTETFFKIGD